MHFPLTFHSYLKPATSPQVPKMYNEIQNLGLFPLIWISHSWYFITSPWKEPYNIIFEVFSVIKIDRQSLTTSSKVSYKYWVSHEASWEWNIFVTQLLSIGLILFSSSSVAALMFLWMATMTQSAICDVIVTTGKCRQKWVAVWFNFENSRCGNTVQIVSL